MKEIANRSCMLMIQFNWENLDTMPLLLLLRYSSNLSTPGWNPRLEAFFSSPSPGWPSRALDLPGLWNSPKVRLVSTWSSAIQFGVFSEPVGLPQEPGRHWHFNRPFRSLGSFLSPQGESGEVGRAGRSYQGFAQLRFLVLPLCSPLSIFLLRCPGKREGCLTGFRS